MVPERPSAEAQISGLLFAVLLLDHQMRIAEANHAAEDMLGQSAKRLIGLDFAEACGVPAAVAKRMAAEGSQLVARGVALRAFSGERDVNLTVSPLTSHPGWQIVTLSDTGQNEMRQNSDNHSALKAPAILAHEIKNPLAAIKGASQLLARKLADGDRALTGMIASEVDRIARLIDRMQELGSSAGGSLAPVNLHQTIRKSMASVRSAASDRAELVEAFDPSLPDVMANADGLEQVLVNLLSNAVDACSGKLDAKVTVRTRFVSGLATNIAGGSAAIRLPIEIAVCDNGAGLDPELGEQVFEPFVTSKKNGQGLGLALVKKLVSDMGGRVNYRRIEADETTEFKLYLAISGQDRR